MKRHDMIKLSDYVISFIADRGVDRIFMLPGGGCMHLVDSVGRNGRLTFTGCLHEQAAVIAADGYAQFRGGLGVALVTTGPGGTNALTGVAGSWIDSTPVLVISGQVKRKDLLAGKGVRQMGIQEVDIISLAKPITKYAAMIEDPTSVRFHLEKAVHLATTGRPGPVWLDIPLDVQGAMIDETTLAGFTPDAKSVSPYEMASNAGVEKAIALLNEAERPVILAGRGIRLAGALNEYIRLVDALQVPVLTTWRAADFLPEDHPLFFGRPGSIASRYANFVQQNADLIFIIGARLDLPQVGHGYENFARAARKVIVDIDEAEIRKTDIDADVSVVGDAGFFVRQFLQGIDSVMSRDRSAWLSRCREWKSHFPLVTSEHHAMGDYVNTYAFIDVLSDLLGENDVIVPGSSGTCAEITLQALRIKAGQRLINCPGLGSMGYGLPQSIGVCLASGGRRTVCIVGDGGLQHNIQELETLKRTKAPVKLFVLNNNAYASIRNTHTRFFEGRLVCCDPSSGLTLPDTCKVAEAYGLPAVRISDQKNLRRDVEEVLGRAGPVVCELMIDPALQTAPRVSSYAKPDGSMASKPLEDLWPFLERDEFRANMLIPLLDE